MRSGRRARRKRRKLESSVTTVQSVTLSHEPLLVSLRRWLQKRGFSSRLLLPAHFSDTGRGLMTLQPIEAGGVLISIPQRCLLTTDTVLSSYLGQYIKRWKPPVSPLLCLCVFLISERHHGDQAEWHPYIQALPTSYTCPAYFPDEVINVLPEGLRGRGLEQREAVQQLYSSSQEFLRSLQPLLSQTVEDVFSYEALRWAFCTVNTRTVYMEHTHTHSCHLNRDRNVYALAPYLDLLNHCPNVQVEGGFSRSNGCYEIRSVQRCRRFQQAFICYGPHDNQRLLLEYGFVAPGNPHSVVYVEEGALLQGICGDCAQLEQKLRFLRENDFLQNLTFGPDGASWRLMTALRLLALTPQMYLQWKSVLLGAAVSEDREQWSIQTALRLCQQLLVENTTALGKIVQMAAGVGQVGAGPHALREQLGLVERLRQEEHSILGRSQEVLLSLQRQWLPYQQDGVHRQPM